MARAWESSPRRPTLRASVCQGLEGFGLRLDSDRNAACRAIEGNVLLYHDAHHLSATYMRTMTPELGRQMGAATGWWPVP